MNFHILTIPQIPTVKRYSSFPFNSLIINFSKMLIDNEQTVYYYGHEENDVCYSSLINLIPKDFYYETYSKEKLLTGIPSYSADSEVIKRFNNNVYKEVNERLSSEDIVLAFYGVEHEYACQQINCINVEPAIGYINTFSKNKIYASHSHMACSTADSGSIKSPTDTVIPHMFDGNDFAYKNIKEDYFLYLGRISTSKGCDIIDNLCKELKFKLKVAGIQVDYKFECEHEYIGSVDPVTRKELLSNAKALIAPTQYFEPFGQIVIEALLSGTPVITTDWGAFVETNIDGITGYRCSTYKDFIIAIKNIEKIKPINCRQQGEKYLINNLKDNYLTYMEFILNYYDSNTQ